MAYEDEPNREEKKLIGSTSQGMSEGKKPHMLFVGYLSSSGNNRNNKITLCRSHFLLGGSRYVTGVTPSEGKSDNVRCTRVSDKCLGLALECDGFPFAGIVTEDKRIILVESINIPGWGKGKNYLDIFSKYVQWVFLAAWKCVVDSMKSRMTPKVFLSEQVEEWGSCLLERVYVSGEIRSSVLVMYAWRCIFDT